MQRLARWCAALSRVRSMQPWGLQLLPAVLNEDIVEIMADGRCQRVEFIVPSCDPEVLEQYDCTVRTRYLDYSVGLLQNAGIKVHLRFWVGGPEESSGEEHRILKTIRALGCYAYSLHPFPFRMDAPLYEEIDDYTEAPALQDWLEWARDPWTLRRPVPLWGGASRVEEVARHMTRIQYAIQRSPKRLARKVFSSVLSKNWIRALEDKSATLLHTVRPPHE